MRLHTHHELIAVMRSDSPVCHAEGLAAHTQIYIRNGGRPIAATLFQVDGEFLAGDEIGLSEAAWQALGVDEGTIVQVGHAPPLESITCVRQRIYGHRLNTAALRSIVEDVVAGRYSDVHLAAFLTATAALPFDEDETYSLTKAMVDAGDRLRWPSEIVVDKHSVGGLPGNRTTPIIVAIAAACGLTMPKTSSRAITSPAGTADTMETLTRVDLDLDAMQRVVASEGGCLAWGGAVRLSPADDIFIGVERALDIDTEGQLIASVLSKKIAAGATHVVLDIPVGPTAKVRSADAAERLAATLTTVAGRFGLITRCVQTDGTQPVGRAIGPALEARDVLAVLTGDPDAPMDLRDRACILAGVILEIGEVALAGTGRALAEQTLADGSAWKKFQRICEAQGGMRTPPTARLTHPIMATHSGRVTHIDNRRIARLAKLAGAPDVPAAGMRLHVSLGDDIIAGQPLLTLHAQSRGEMAYALTYAASNPDMIVIVP
ncbi:thymidine phosphorylase family protein [Sphingopyxis granuli]|uniref:thymidine phosphorylase family protein n=1 Tax=Sphingopyxis granuli TaxID=267128 RepID=UPI0009EDFE4E|nr:thymidine phosphorylase family protein [Sphingopyxis granuli]